MRGTRLDHRELFDENGEYSYTGGWNIAAVVALALGVLPNLPGFLHAAFPASFANVPAFFNTLYTYAWFVGLAISRRIVLMACGLKAATISSPERQQRVVERHDLHSRRQQHDDPDSRRHDHRCRTHAIRADVLCADPQDGGTIQRDRRRDLERPPARRSSMRAAST